MIPFSSPDQVVITLSISNDLYMLFFDNVTHADQMKNNEKMNVSRVYSSIYPWIKNCGWVCIIYNNPHWIINLNAVTFSPTSPIDWNQFIVKTFNPNIPFYYNKYPRIPYNCNGNNFFHECSPVNHSSG